MAGKGRPPLITDEKYAQMHEDSANESLDDIIKKGSPVTFGRTFCHYDIYF